MLKNENDDLTFKLRKTEAILSRVREELAHFRAANGRSPRINFEEEQRLESKLKVSNSMIMPCLLCFDPSL